MKPQLLTEKLIEDRKIKQEKRTYIGASLLGSDCPRSIWYEFRHHKTIYITPRLERLFSRGHREEPIIIADLEKIGIKVLATQESAKFCKGHGGAHHDGRLINVPDAPKTEHLLECKTINDKGFHEMVRQGVEKCRPRYWIQIHVYMGLFKLKRCLFIVVNKNTDERYYERVKFKKSVYKQAIRRAEDIVFSPYPPRKLSQDPEFFKCKWCDFQNICHHGEFPEKTCRSCYYSAPVEKGKWYCAKRKKGIKKNKPCSHWQLI